MKITRRTLLAGAVSVASTGGIAASATSEAQARKTKVKGEDAVQVSPQINKISAKEELFPLRDIHLDGGVLSEAQERNRQYLLKLEPDRLLSWTRREAGLSPKAPPYRGWESEEPLLPGHILGFYLSGAAMTVQATGDRELRRRLDYLVDQLADVQAANHSGYALAVPNGKAVFRDIAAGKIEIGGLPWTGYQINGNFEPTYTLNKLMLGLYQVWLATGSPKAKQVLIRLADWFGGDVLDHLTTAQIQTLLDCEHGSLNESFADVYRLTDDAKYRRWARLLCHEHMLEPLARGDGAFLTHYHANTQIPKFTGFENVYRDTGEVELDAAAVNFWNEVVDRRTWVIGGNSAEEHFFDPNDVHAVDGALRAPAGPETCNTVNMLRLTEALYPVHPSARLIDYYERALFNHLLSAHDPERGMCAYYTSMRPGAYRVYGDEFDSMWCCTGTGLEAPGKYGQMTYTRSSDNVSVSVQLFASSTLTWREQGVTLRQTTDFPREARTTLRLTCVKPIAFTLRVRHPAWVADGALAITVNGKPVGGDTRRGEYAAISRVWRTGDVVGVALPMRLRAETLSGDDRYVALLYGPIVLSGALGRAGDLQKLDFYQIGTTVPTKSLPDSSVPFLVADSAEDVVRGVRPVAGKPLTFQIEGVTDANPRFPTSPIELIPFFENHFQRYAIYWRRMNAADWQKETADRAENAALDARTLDRVKIGDAASESAHGFQGLRTQTGVGAYDEFPDSHWRDARDSGSFSYIVAVTPNAPATLRLVFWGKEIGARTFDVQIDGQIVRTLTLGDTGKHAFFPIDIALSTEQSKGKTHITVTLQAHPGNTAGGLFDLRILRPDTP